jgi:hypothetical protein
MSKDMREKTGAIYKVDKHRWKSMLIAALFLVGMTSYAYLKAPEIRSVAHDFDNNYITSNGSKVLATSEHTFSVNWRHGRPRTFNLKTSPPFSAGDVVAFKLNVRDEPAILEEYHVWEDQSIWYAKLLVSVPPLVFVIVLLFREFRWSGQRKILLRRM